MRSLPIPEEEQIRAMLDGSVFDILGQYITDPARTDFRRFLTVDRQKLLGFLVSHPEKAKQYFGKASRISGEKRIYNEGTQFAVASMDRGQQRSVRYFNSMAEAVVEHVLVSHGMY